MKPSWSWAAPLPLTNPPDDFQPVAVACVGGLRFVCTLKVGGVVLFSIKRILNHKLAKAKKALPVAAMYQATSLRVISESLLSPRCITMIDSQTVAVTDGLVSDGKSDVKDIVDSVKCVCLQTGEVRVLSSDFQSTFGIAKLSPDGFVISDPKANQVWVLNTKLGTKTLLAGSGAQGTVDGVATESTFAVPVGIAAEGRTVYVASGDGTLRIISRTSQACAFMRSTRQFGEVFGMLGSRERRSMPERAKARGLSWDNAIANLQSIVDDRSQWYHEARNRLGLPPEAKGLNGPEGVPSLATFAAWSSTLDEMKGLRTDLVAAGCADIVQKLKPHRPNQMDAEHMFSQSAKGYDHVQTQKTYVPQIDRMIEEHVVSRCDSGFSHVTNLEP